jgi:glycosyltransferase involved in cell wall biosynthesis
MAQAMIIAFYMPRVVGGGAELMTVQIAGDLSKRGHTVLLIANSNSSGQVAIPPGVTFIPLRHDSILGAARALKIVLEQNNVAVLVSILPLANLIANVARTVFGSKVKVINAWHGFLKSATLGRGFLAQALCGVISRMADANIAVSAALRDALIGAGVPKRKLHLIYNGVPGPAAVAPFIGARPYVLNAASLTAHKNQAMLIEAFAQFSKVFDWDLVIAGQGVEEERLRAQITKLQLTDRVHLVGFRSDISRYYAGASMFVLSSNVESFSNVLVEAMSFGVPVVATDCGGPREVLDGGEFGRLVPPGDVDPLAAAMSATARTPGNGQRLKARAAVFSLNKTTDQYESLCGDIVEQRKTSVDGGAMGVRPTVAFFLPNLSGGGAERMTLNLLPEMRARGYSVSLVITNREGELSAALPDDVELISLDVPRTWAALVPLIRMIRKRRPAAIISALGHNNVLAIVACRLAGQGTKVLIRINSVLSQQARETDDWRQTILPLLYRLVAKYADAIIAVSRGAADDFIAVTGVARDRVQVVYNPVLRPAFAAEAAAPVDHPFFQPGRPPVFVSVGRLAPVKDPKTLLKAFARVRADHDVRLALVGDGEMRDELTTMARNLQIEDSVAFVGFQINPIRYIAKAKALIVSSRHEGFGNVIVEALAADTPVISTDCPYGPGEILDGGRFGRLVPVGDVEALARSMVEVLSDASDPAAAEARAREFTVEAVARQYEQLLASVGVPA